MKSIGPDPIDTAERCEKCHRSGPGMYVLVDFKDERGKRRHRGWWCAGCKRERGEEVKK